MNRSDALEAPRFGSHPRLRISAVALVVLALAVAVTPGVPTRLINALSRAFGRTSLPGPHFSDPPTDDEILRAGLFDQPLVPIGPTNPDENRQLATLLVAYSKTLLEGERDAVQPLAGFVAQYPHSVWTPGLELELGAVYRQTGHFSKALVTWQSSWEASKDLTSTDGRIVGDMAAAYLSQFEAYLGRKELLAPLLEDLKTRPVRGSAAELVSESSRGLAEMESRPDVAFKCGPSALARILKQHPTSDVPASRRVLGNAQSTPNGLSLSAVQAISVEAGLNYQMAYRSPGAPVLVPAVAHWKVGHYAAVLGRDARGRLWVGDSTFGEDIAVTSPTFDEETSGYFLVPPGALPAGWRHVAADEGGSVWGRGDTGGYHDNGATGRAEMQAFAPGGCGGCTTWNVEAAVVGLELRDDPVGYTPPFGPAIRFPMTYSHRDTEQKLPFTYTNFGNKWTFDWLSYVIDDKNNFNGQVVTGAEPGLLIIGIVPGNYLTADLYRRGGGDEPYVFTGIPTDSVQAPNTSQASAEGQFSQAYLTRYTDSGGYPTHFTRTLPDGSVEKFTPIQGNAGIPGTKFFMTEVDDPQGNAVKINFDSLTRITSVVDASGQQTRICYNDSPAPCVAPAASVNPPSNLQVTRIIDPFGRFATFGYDPSTGHLTSITDVLEITSMYQYGTGTTSENVDFINALTTPYGETTFAYTESPNLSAAGNYRSLKATEHSVLASVPDRISYVEFLQGNGNCIDTMPTFPSGSTFDTDGIECVDGNMPGNYPFGLTNGLLDYRNTFIWNPAQYAATTFGTPTQYLGAKLIHWLHTDENDANPLTAGRVPESIKEPLENRVWFLYPGQSKNMFGASGQNAIGVGTTNQPSAVIRAVGDGTFQTWQFQYDNYGHVMQSIDPVGRTLSMTYDQTNFVDLLTVTNTTPGHSDAFPILKLSNYIQHRPQQVTGANVETTQLRYNAIGQLASSTDPFGHTWTYNYAPATGGFLTGIVGPTVSAPAGPQIPSYTFTYDNVGRLWTEEGPDQQMLTFSYDAADRLTETVFPDQTTELRGYTLEGTPPTPLLDLTSFKDRMGNTTTRRYDGFREVVEIDEPSELVQGVPAARITKLSYGPDGTVQAVTDPLNQITSYTRDVQGRVKTITNPDNTTQWYTYDPLGRVLSKSPGQAETLPGTILYAYNLDDTLSKAFLDARAPTAFAYDPAYPRLTGWSRIQGGTWAQPTCASGTTCPTLDQESYTYWPAGTDGANKVSQVVTTIVPPYEGVVPATVTSRYGYDSLDRIITKSIYAAPSGVNATEGFQYDAIGRLTSDSNLLDSFKYAYADATARISGRTSAGGPQVAASYFPPQQDGLLQQLSYTAPSGTALAQYIYGYDARHNVTSFSDSNTGASSYTYDAYSQLSSAVLPGGLSRPTLSVLPDPSGNISSLQTIRNINGRPTSTLVGFTYDAANKMTQETTTTTGLISSKSIQQVSSDAWMGSLETIGAGATEQTYATDQSNRLAAYVTGGYASGNGTFSGFTYDGLGRLSEVSDEVAANGSRTTAADHSYVWCGQRMCLEINNLASIAAGSGQTTQLPDALYVAQGTVNNPPTTATPVSSSQLAYDITDLLGSERGVVTNNATVALYNYDTFGNRGTQSGSASASNRGFTGFYYHAASGLQFARNRVYNASLGRWMTRDPIGNAHAFKDRARFNATDLNLYAYVGNNPQSMIDPSGNFGLVGAAAGLIAGGVGGYLTSGTWQGALVGAGVGLVVGIVAPQLSESMGAVAGTAFGLSETGASALAGTTSGVLTNGGASLLGQIAGNLWEKQLWYNISFGAVAGASIGGGVLGSVEGSVEGSACGQLGKGLAEGLAGGLAEGAGNSAQPPPFTPAAPSPGSGQ